MISEHKIQKKKLIGGITLAICLVLFTSILLKPLLESFNVTNTSNFIIRRFFCWLTLLVIYMYSLHVEKQALMIWTNAKYSFGYYLKSILLTLLVAHAFVLVSGIVLSFLNVSLGSTQVEDMFTIHRNNIYLIVFTSLTAGITEELIFRSYFMTRLQLLIKNKYITILLTALFFGLAHASYGTAFQLVMPFVIGLVFGMHYFKYRNIYILIIVHFLVDFIALATHSF